MRALITDGTARARANGITEAYDGICPVSRVADVMGAAVYRT